MIRPTGLDRSFHSTSPKTPDGTLNACKNADMGKDGQAGVRDGLARPANWPGILFTSTGLESTTTAKSGTFGQAVRSLIPVDQPGISPPVVTFGES